METYRSEKFISIGRKIVMDVTLLMVLFIIVFSLYIYSSMQKNALNRYEQQVLINTEVSGGNINHYISSMITATKSVYINHPLMEFLKDHHSRKELEENEARITGYFKSIYYASTVASQIYLVLPNENFSILYEPRQLKFTSSGISDKVNIPNMQSFSDVYVEPTHVKTDYGHHIPALERYPADELVITVWLPISDLPADPRPIAYMAIDLPISFITENCSVINEAEETIYVVDEDNMIIASSDPEAQMKNFLEYYPRYQRAGEDNILIKYRQQLLAETRIDSRYFDWSIIKAAPARSVYALTTGQMVSMLVLFGVLAFAFLTMTSLRILKYVKSLREITRYMEKERERKSWDHEKKLKDYIIYCEKDEISSLIDSFQRLMDSLKEHSIQKYELKLAYTRSELKTMQAQINPHFIYNVIQCFATNALKNNNLKQYQMISSFGQMLHYAMVLEPSMVSVDKEIEYSRRYIALQQMRFEKQLAMVCEIDPASVDFKIPKMSIQPLIENSITHGNLMRKDGSVIKLKTEIRDDRFHLLVEDNGIPVSEETVGQVCHKVEQIREKLFYQDGTAAKKQTAALNYTVREDENHNHFIGIENVFSRLLLSFGGCDFKICANNINGTTVEFMVPLKAEPFREVEE
ncbi:histidine kinase [Clostridium sp. AN503]|uniref:cache domain-containing sensor histidine kinase n=1 Tax=Clostridium sp. AN503 TaxID=3160598 RepID=UPI0034591D64